MFVAATLKTVTTKTVEHVVVQLTLKEAQEISRAAGASSDQRLAGLYSSLTSELRSLQADGVQL